MIGATLPAWFVWTRNVSALLIAVSCLLTLTAQRYIARRYEDETALAKLRFFQNPLLFALKPGLRASVKRVVYTMHVFMIWVLPDGLRRRLPAFSDVRTRSDVTSHFSGFEIALCAFIGVCGVVGIVTALGAAVTRPFL